MRAVITPSARTTPSTMRYPWQRLRADGPAADMAANFIFVVVMAFFTSSATAHMDFGPQLWPWALMAFLLPALAVLLVVPDPNRYRVHGLSTRAWLVDHGILVALVLGIHAFWPLWAILRPTGSGDHVPWSTAVPPVLGVIMMSIGVLWRFRRSLSGRELAGTSTTTPWYQRLFLARQGPTAWRIVYQPILLVSLLAFAVFALITYSDGGSSSSPASIQMLSVTLIAPVVSVCCISSVAVGMPRKMWTRHIFTAALVCQALMGLTYILVAAHPSLPGSLTQMDDRYTDSSFTMANLVLLVISTIAVSVAAAALCVGTSFEEWSSVIAWAIVFNIVFGIVNVFSANSNSLGLGTLTLVLNAALAGVLVFYSRTRALVGRPMSSLKSNVGGDLA
jgi:hypothetical protein